MLRSKKPVIAVVAVRTGCGKSQVSRKIFQLLKQRGLRVAAIRHPMPYNTDLTTQVMQRFSQYEDIDKYETTIEEREEYEPYIDEHGVVYAGVDYEKILHAAEEEADVIIWDGGNNDFPFIAADLFITIADPHRPGHETSYYPGEVNVRCAHVIIINKVNTAGSWERGEGAAQLSTNQPYGPDYQGRFDGHGAGFRGNRWEAGPRHRGWTDSDPWEHAIWGRDSRGTG